jgi:type I restriction enzyme S subunit
MVETTEITQEFQKTDAGVIPSDWNCKKLSKVAQFDNGTAHERFIDEHGDFVVVNSKFISTESETRKYSNKNLSPLFKDDIAIVMSDIPNGRALAKCFLVDEDNRYTLNQRIGRVKANEDIDCNFLYYIINRNKYFLSFDSGTGQTNLKKREIEDCPLPFPPTKKEQTAIATALNDADKHITELEKLIFKKRNIRQSAMQEFLRPKAGWIDKMLDEIGDFKKGRNIPKTSLLDDGVSCVLYGEIYTTYNYHSSELFSKISKETARDSTEINYGDILFAGSGETAEDIGKCFVYTGTTKAYAGGDVIILSPNNCDEIFLGFLLNSFNVTKQKSQLGQGSSVFHIYPYHLKLIQVSLPSTKDEQKQIGRILLDMDAEIEAMDKKLVKHRKIRQGMMQNLLTGKIRLV